MSQAKTLREQMKALEQLQEIDLKIDQLKKSRGSLPAALKTLDDGVARLRQTVETKKNSLADLEKAQRQTQAAVELNNDRLSRSTSKLEGVQNSQEYQAAQKELEQLRKMSLTLEEQGKKATTEISNTQQQIADLGAQLDKAQAERDAKAGEVSGQDAKFQGEIDSLTKERSAFTGQVEARILSTYDRVRVARAGIGIVPAVAGRCKGCNMMVPPQQYNEIQRGSTIHQCPSCHRILYVPAQAEGGK